MTQSSSASGWTTLAHLLRPQGRRGELLAELLTDFPELFTSRPDVFLAPPNFTGPACDARPVTITGHWLPVGRNHGRVVLAFAGIDSINLAEPLANHDILIPADQRAPLEDDDAAYISDLLGCTVFDGQNPIGEVTAVDFPTSPDGLRRLADAAPLLTVLTPANDEVLIPYVKGFLVELDLAGRRILMTLPTGLLDLNRP